MKEYFKKLYKIKQIKFLINYIVVFTGIMTLAIINAILVNFLWYQILVMVIFILFVGVVVKLIS